MRSFISEDRFIFIRKYFNKSHLLRPLTLTCLICSQAWNAMWSNALQVATINGIGDFILFLGKVTKISNKKQFLI